MLTEQEHEALDLTGDLASLMVYIIEDGSTHDEDMAEFVHHLHGIQNMILAQAAGRMYPERYRTLGSSL